MDDLLGNTTCSVVALVAYVWFIRCWDGSIIGPVDERAHCHVQNDTPQSVVFFRWENTWNVHSHRRMTHQTLREQKTAHKKRQKKLQPTREPTIWGSDSNKKTTLKMKFSTSLFIIVSWVFSRRNPHPHWRQLLNLPPIIAEARLPLKLPQDAPGSDPLPRPGSRNGFAGGP